MKSHKNEPRNNRWKWMAGATAATAAGVTASQGSTITINLNNNYISATGGNNLNADLTGDGHPDLTIANNTYYTYLRRGATFSAAITLNGVRAFGTFHNAGTSSHFFLIERMRLGSRYARDVRGVNFYNGTTFYRYGSTRSLTGSIPVFFKDLHINGGAPTEGSLEVTVSVFGADPTVQLDSFTYNDPSFAVPDRGSSLASVPDQGSSLALLAMGAGGILAFRRWRATQERS